ncbi:bile acid:sodium symporter family protein [Piscirickettsia salmonis]|uniref:bile acid:sodium symporter family protein n=1 Tax=Piscirickettsia salmonis TaxID=1238 RepID=UPI0007C95AC7|nr:Sodium Bile acid symporter family protein [Piscirickettsiaceae bacterium NZ-RLO1]
MKRLLLPVCVFFIALGVIFPSVFHWVKPNITLLLSAIMFSLGFLYKKSQIKSISNNYIKLILMCILKFIVGTVLAILISNIFKLDINSGVALVVLAAVPSAMSASAMSCAVGANFIINIFCTDFMMLICPLVTPLLIMLATKNVIDIGYISMLKSLVLMFLMPILMGVFFKEKILRKVDLSRIMNLVILASIGVLVGFIASSSKNEISDFSVMIFAVPLYILIMYIIGFSLSKVIKLSHEDSIAIANEFAMIDCALAVFIIVTFMSINTGLSIIIATIYQNVICILAPVAIKIIEKIKYNAPEVI